jgi:hypothetical protein
MYPLDTPRQPLSLIHRSTSGRPGYASASTSAEPSSIGQFTTSRSGWLSGRRAINRAAVQSALADTWGMRDGELDSPTARWLYRTMRSAELSGTDPAAAVRQAIGSRDLAGARDIPAVIDARLRWSVNGLAPQPSGRWSDRVPQAGDPEIREYLGKLATLMDERRGRG